MLSILRFCVLLQTGKNKEESLVLVTLGRQESVVVRRWVQESDCLGDPQLSRLTSLRLWTGCLIALCLSFLTCKPGMIILCTPQNYLSVTGDDERARTVPGT